MGPLTCSHAQVPDINKKYFRTQKLTYSKGYALSEGGPLALVCDAEPRKAPEPLSPLEQNGAKEATAPAPHLPKWVIHDKQVMHRPELGKEAVSYSALENGYTANCANTRTRLGMPLTKRVLRSPSMINSTNLLKVPSPGRGFRFCKNMGALIYA